MTQLSCIQFLVFFIAPGGGNAIGILPINNPPSNQFRSVAAKVIIVGFQFTVASTIADISDSVTVGSVAADLFQIEQTQR